MKNIYYGILPVVAFLLILTNAFYGHAVAGYLASHWGNEEFTKFPSILKII